MRLLIGYQVLQLMAPSIYIQLFPAIQTETHQTQPTSTGILFELYHSHLMYLGHSRYLRGASQCLNHLLIVSFKVQLLYIYSMHVQYVTGILISTTNYFIEFLSD